MAEFLKKICVLLLLCSTILARIHKLKIENDMRSKIDLTTFGFLKKGQLAINLTNFHYEYEHMVDEKPATKYSFGFSLGKTSNDNLQEREESCLINEYKFDAKEGDEGDKLDKGLSLILFTLDLDSNPPCIHLRRIGEDLKHLNISIPSKQVMQATLNSPSQRRKRRSLDFLSDSFLFPHIRNRRETKDDPQREISEKEVAGSGAGSESGSHTTTLSDLMTTTLKPTQEVDEAVLTDNSTKVNETSVPSVKPVGAQKQLVTTTIPLKKNPETGRYSTYFLVDIKTDDEEGLYNLFFHNCDNNNKAEPNKHKSVNFTVHLAESNYDGKNYLSAGEIPLPAVYMILCAIYFVLAVVWWFVIRKATDGVFKTHYMMLVFLFVKCISLFFHSINFHFIQIEGHHEAAFAILYYITYLMKGTLLFVTIVLVGAGWAFVKHILSKRDKKIFIIVIPLQILANVAQIIIEETEEGQSQYLVWKQLFIMLDLLCCGAILFPVIWSIRHLQDASQTDGKAAINLSKLKIFRHFYIMIVCYIYFTRIIVYLLAMTLPFQFTWMCTVFKEVAALVFFVVTGYKFRPASDNPYLQIPQSDDEVEMDEVLTESGATAGLTRVNIKVPGNSTSLSTKQRESSHEYD